MRMWSSLCVWAACAAVVTAQNGANGWQQADTWYLCGDTFRALPVVEFADGGEVVVVRSGPEPARHACDPSRLVDLSKVQADALQLLVAGQSAPRAYGNEPRKGSQRQWAARFEELLQFVVREDGQRWTAELDDGRYYLVMLWHETAEKRSLAWIPEASICAPVSRLLEDEPADLRRRLFFEQGVVPTETSEVGDGGDGAERRVLAKSVLRSTRDRELEVTVHRRPGGTDNEPAQLRVLRHYYVYGRVRVGDASWYLIGDLDTIAIQEGSGTRSSLIGWIPESRVIIWGTAQSVEFDEVTRPQRTYVNPRGGTAGLAEIHGTWDALDEAYGSSITARPTAVATEMPEDFDRDLTRMPVLERREFVNDHGTFTAYRVAFLATDLKLAREQQDYFDKLKAGLDQLSTIEVLFVVDATMNSGVFVDTIRRVITGIWSRIEEHNRNASTRDARSLEPLQIRLRAGALAYRDWQDGSYELEVRDFVDDPAKFSNLFDEDHTDHLQFGGGLAGSRASDRRALRAMLDTVVTGHHDFVVDARVKAQVNPRRQKRRLQLDWSPGSVRLVVVLGDVGQDAQTDREWTTDGFRSRWLGLTNAPSLVAIQVSQHDWFTYPDDEDRSAARRGYQRFADFYRSLASQVADIRFGGDAAITGAFVKLANPDEDARKGELAAAIERVWRDLVEQRTVVEYEKIVDYLRTRVHATAKEAGTIIARIEDAVGPAPESSGPISYGEGWIVGRVPIPGTGFNLPQVRPCVWMGKQELRFLNSILLEYLIAWKGAIVNDMRGQGELALGKALAANLARDAERRAGQIDRLFARQPALHFLRGMLRLGPDEFARMSNHEVMRWGSAVRTASGDLDRYLSDASHFTQDDRPRTWLPLDILPRLQGQMDIARADLRALADDVLKPFAAAFVEAGARRLTGDEATAGRLLAAWMRGSDPGKAMRAVMRRAQLGEARVGLLAMSPDQVGLLRPVDFERWHAAVLVAIDDCNKILEDRSLWLADRTSMSVKRLPNLDRVGKRDRARAEALRYERAEELRQTR